jgi:LysR family transcriptional regulator, hydrogen peroxide-inducible genes activator
VNLLLLAEGHCLAEQAMEVCHIREWQGQGEMADLRVSSLETLIQLVSAGFGVTLVPALAMRGYWTTDRGVVAQPHLTAGAGTGAAVETVLQDISPRGDPSSRGPLHRMA